MSHRKPLAGHRSGPFVASAWLFLFCIVGTLDAQEKYTLRRAYLPGHTWTFDASQDYQTKSQLTVGGQVANRFEQSVRSHRAGRAEVLEARNGLPTVVRVTFDKDCTTVASMNGQEQILPFAFAGETITIRLDNNGNITHDFKGQVDPQSQAELKSMVDPDVSYYPKNPVVVGEEWSGDPQAVAKTFRLANKDDVAGLTAKLLSIKEVGGRRAAEVKVSTACEMHQPDGSQIKQITQGIMLVDLQTGAALSIDMKGPVTASGERQVQGQFGQPMQQVLSGEGTLTIRGAMHLVDSKGVAKAAGANPADLPAAGAPKADDAIAGRYVSDKLQVELRRGDNGYSGTVSMGAKRFPLSAQADGQTIRGRFESGGNHFDFTATVDGGTMTFATGSSKYSLKKDQPPAANPLDPPAAANPLDAPRPPDAPAAEAPAGALPNGTARFTRFAIHDPMVNNQEATTFLIPTGWKVEGGVVWKENPYAPVSLAVRVFNPQGAESGWSYPQGTFMDGVRESVAQTAAIAGPQAVAHAMAAFPEGGNYMGAEIRRRIPDPAAYVRDFVIPRFRQDLRAAKVVEVKDLPDLAQAHAASMGQIPGLKVQCQRVRLEYPLQGHPMDEDVYVTLTSMPMVSTIISWNADAQSYRAARGKLDAMMPVYRTIDRSGKMNLQWYAAVMEVSKMMQDNIRQSIDNAGKLSRYIAARNNEITDIIRESYQKRQESQDRIHDQFDQHIRGVERYSDSTAGQSYEVPSGYDHAFVSNRGEVILSNDPNFRPGEVFHEDFRELQKQR